MKQLKLLVFLPLLACNGESDKNIDVNDDELSSVVANTSTPEETSSSNLHKGHKHDANVESEATKDITSIKYFEEKHAFGKVFYPSENKHTFKFTNTGNHPLIIESARASCGCTIPNKPEEPIMPGEEGELDVIFRPKEGQIGSPVTKRITVVANTEPKETYLEISADVAKGMEK